MGAVVRGQTKSAEADRLNQYQLFSAENPASAIAALKAGPKAKGK
jgi:hypothetical protein